MSTNGATNGASQGCKIEKQMLVTKKTKRLVKMKRCADGGH